MVAFKGRRMVQPRGKFYKAVEGASGEDEESATVGRGGGGEPLPEPCHNCGGTTHRIGMVSGDWRKERGAHSGKVHWHLKDPPEMEVDCG